MILVAPFLDRFDAWVACRTDCYASAIAQTLSTLFERKNNLNPPAAGAAAKADVWGGSDSRIESTLQDLPNNLNPWWTEFGLPGSDEFRGLS